MKLLGNLIWLIFGGFLAALGYIIGGIVLCLTIIGIPWGIQCFKIATLVLWPFGKKVVSEPNSGGCLSLFCNIVWLLCGGLYTAIIHLIFALLLAITIIGIPFARQHLKLVELSLMPFGKRIVEEWEMNELLDWFSEDLTACHAKPQRLESAQWRVFLGMEEFRSQKVEKDKNIGKFLFQKKTTATKSPINFCLGVFAWNIAKVLIS
jgi:uncharacterized membrane protein YccF (DUF307 family)